MIQRPATESAPRVHEFTREEYYRMGELGFFRGHRTELINGQIVDKSAMDSCTSPDEEPRLLVPTVTGWTWQFSRDDYYRLAELGLIPQGHVELIDGQVVDMAPMDSRHAVSVMLVFTALQKVIGSERSSRVQLPVTFLNFREPEPDVAVVLGAITDYADAHPSQPELIVEVASSSLAYDRTTKLELYALNDVQEYWIVNLNERCLEVYRSPRTVDGRGSYESVEVWRANGSIQPLCGNAAIRVSELFA